MAIKFSFLFFSLKLLIFRLVITYFGTPTLHQITPFLSKIFRGSIPRDPPSNSVFTQCYGATNTPAMLLSFRYLALFKGNFEEYLSDIYLLDLTEVK